MLAILEVTEKIHEFDTEGKRQNTVAIYTDSKISKQPQENMYNQIPLVEKVRETLKTFQLDGWAVEISWIKAH